MGHLPSVIVMTRAFNDQSDPSSFGELDRRLEKSEFDPEYRARLMLRSFTRKYLIGGRTSYHQSVWSCPDAKLT